MADAWPAGSSPFPTIPMHAKRDLAKGTLWQILRDAGLEVEGLY